MPSSPLGLKPACALEARNLGSLREAQFIVSKYSVIIAFGNSIEATHRDMDKPFDYDQKVLSDHYGRRGMLVDEYLDHLLSAAPVRSSVNVNKLEALNDEITFRLNALEGLRVLPEYSDHKPEMAGLDVFDLVMTERGDWAQSTKLRAVLDLTSQCTATLDNTCQIVDYLPALNVFLFYAELERRELLTPSGRLSLASLAKEGLLMPYDSEKTLKQAVAVVHRLLKTHRCIEDVQVYRGIFAARVPLVCNALKCNLSMIRTLRLDFGKIFFNQGVDSTIASMDFLEESEHLEQRSYNELSSALSTDIRHSSSLTTLDVAELRMKAPTAAAFVAVLTGNSTLEELSIYGSMVCEAKYEFARYLGGNVFLTTLTIKADDASWRNCFTWPAKGLLVNNTIRNVHLNNFRFDFGNAALAAGIFAENKSIQSFNLMYTPHALDAIPSTDYGFWLAPLSANETLEEPGQPLSIWKPEQWVDFFASASRKQSLKKLTVALHVTDHRHLPVPCVDLQENEAEEVSLGTYLAYHTLNLIHSKAFSDVDVFCFGNVAGRLSQELLAFGHVTSIRFTLQMGDVSLASAIAAYIEATSSLRKLRLTIYTDNEVPPQDANPSWTAVLESLSRNRSARELVLHVDIDSKNEDGYDAHGSKQHQLERLGQVVRTSGNVRRLHIQAENTPEISIFLRSLSEGIAANCCLIRVSMSGVLDNEVAQSYYNARETASRNYSLVTRAQQFARGRTLDR
ncbi:hypothetical protein HPB50_002944 [Hyalomma asiaticum]|uniref:Uncharacterized protein n=1 Tax=Hyalomma asiaticum TaxID=266040 RepID=A0ACB7T7Q1_HYAAI|nr:hypothetical protein HPB50_002944 [Hyalomma asiaticum]